jgi:hypothetical protein
MKKEIKKQIKKSKPQPKHMEEEKTPEIDIEKLRIESPIQVKQIIEKKEEEQKLVSSSVTPLENNPLPIKEPPQETKQPPQTATPPVEIPYSKPRQEGPGLPHIQKKTNILSQIQQLKKK